MSFCSLIKSSIRILRLETLSLFVLYVLLRTKIHSKRKKWDRLGEKWDKPWGEVGQMRQSGLVEKNSAIQSSGSPGYATAGPDRAR